MPFQVVELRLDAEDQVIDRRAIPYPYPQRLDAVDTIETLVVQVRGNGQKPEKLEWKSMRQIANRESLSRRIERAVEADKSEAGEPGRVFTEH